MMDFSKLRKLDIVNCIGFSKVCIRSYMTNFELSYVTMHADLLFSIATSSILENLTQRSVRYFLNESNMYEVCVIMVAITKLLGWFYTCYFIKHTHEQA